MGGFLVIGMASLILLPEGSIVAIFVAPNNETESLINDWLTANDIQATPIFPGRNWLRLNTTVGIENQAFDTQFSIFTQQETRQLTIRTLAYSVPATLKEHIELVHPTIAFPVLTQDASSFRVTPFNPTTVSPLVTNLNLISNAVPTSCNTVVTPACLQALYGLPASVPQQNVNQIDVGGFNNQFVQSADLKSFLSLLRTDINSNPNFSFVGVDGGTNSQSPAVAGGVPTTFVSLGTAGGIIGVFAVAETFLQANALPNVITGFFGINEADNPQSIATVICSVFMQFGPVESPSSLPLVTEVYPRVTSVGATTGISPETAATFSGGGFSNFFSFPSYQTSQVKSYLPRLGSTNTGNFNLLGRAYPDVSTQGQNILFFSGGIEVLGSSTAASIPIFVSAIAYINAHLAAAKLPPVGFLNPVLYHSPGAFNDIKKGSNPGCSTNGFPALAGWNPVTGVGTPNFASLKTIFGPT
ncbi:hypothetical protein M422DRAFT_259419 [Sphaerobolus stellatus SS14]|uniref:Peptidase S53 domain-containing protein n=1 Tax=Sphaerobolus stellatus (strain SS14) TaxID=990650 RepID=A0A0C9UT35_SPHS4|nr:hypothetical protein M422DRAFT_259419 [Sphaerobolus stellatus SS14]